MYTYHLWIVLSESTEEFDEGGLTEKVEELRRLVALRIEARPNNPVCEVNNEWVFQCSVMHNHRGDAHERLKNILVWIADQLPGSYGLVYWNDDEDEDRDMAGSFQVLVIARGKITERNDAFLSPIVPTVED